MRPSHGKITEDGDDCLNEKKNTTRRVVFFVFFLRRPAFVSR